MTATGRPLDQLTHRVRAILPNNKIGVERRKPSFAAIMSLAWQHHGKGRVRLGRVWREGSTHHFVEWQVQSMLESDMSHAYLSASNEGMVATDTQVGTCACPTIMMAVGCQPNTLRLSGRAKQGTSDY